MHSRRLTFPLTQIALLRLFHSSFRVTHYEVYTYTIYLVPIIIVYLGYDVCVMARGRGRALPSRGFSTWTKKKKIINMRLGKRIRVTWRFGDSTHTPRAHVLGTRWCVSGSPAHGRRKYVLLLLLLFTPILIVCLTDPINNTVALVCSWHACDANRRRRHRSESRNNIIFGRVNIYLNGRARVRRVFFSGRHFRKYCFFPPPIPFTVVFFIIILCIHI